MTKTILDLLKLTERFTAALNNGLDAKDNETGQKIPSLQVAFNRACKEALLRDFDSRQVLRIYNNAMQRQKDCVNEIVVAGPWSSTPFSTIEQIAEKHAAEIISGANELAKAVLIPGKLYSEAQLRALMGTDNRTAENYESFRAMGWQADFLAKLCQP